MKRIGEFADRDGCHETRQELTHLLTNRLKTLRTAAYSIDTGPLHGCRAQSAAE